MDVSKHRIGNLPEKIRIDPTNKELVELLANYGLWNETNKKIAERGKLFIFKEMWALEVIAVVDFENEECVLIDTREWEDGKILCY